MLTESPPGALDLLVVGGLTVDRFEDGLSAPGGSVMHIARAAAPRGVRLGIVTAGGPEIESAAGLAELERLSARLEAASHPATTTFRHQERPDGRRLWLERVGGMVHLGADAVDRFASHAVLLAPVAGEIGADGLRVVGDAASRGAILQGWLRATGDDGEVMQQELSALDRPLLEALGGLDLLVASREDLAAESDSPSEQLTALRAALGRRPVLVVTDGAEGLWLAVSGARPELDWREHLPVPWRVEGVATVGAGDILAAFLTMGAKDPPGGWRGHAESAMGVVAEALEERRAG